MCPRSQARWAGSMIETNSPGTEWMRWHSNAARVAVVRDGGVGGPEVLLYARGKQGEDCMSQLVGVVRGERAQA